MQRLVESTNTEGSFNLEKFTPISPCDYPKKKRHEKADSNQQVLKFSTCTTSLVIPYVPVLTQLESSTPFIRPIESGSEMLWDNPNERVDLVKIADINVADLSLPTSKVRSPQ